MVTYVEYPHVRWYRRCRDGCRWETDSATGGADVEAEAAHKDTDVVNTACHCAHECHRHAPVLGVRSQSLHGAAILFTGVALG